MLLLPTSLNNAFEPRINDKWVCGKCGKSFDFRSDANECCRIQNNEDIDTYQGFSKRTLYKYKAEIVEIMRICTYEYCKNFFIQSHTDFTGFCEWLTISEAKEHLKEMV